MKSAQDLDLGCTLNPLGPRIWVIVVTWRTPTITATLCTYLKMILPQAIQLVLVQCDQNQPAPLDKLFQGVTVLTPKSNLGYAGGNNLGLRYALEHGADYAVVLNSDVFPMVGTIEAMIERLNDDKTLGACGSATARWIPGRGLDVYSAAGFDWRTGNSRRSGLLEMTKEGFVPGAIVAFSARALLEVGLFDSNLFLMYEEIDWAERARAHGFALGMQSDSIALDLGSPSMNQAPRAMTYYMMRNRLWILRRYAMRHGERLRPYRHIIYACRVVAGHLIRGRWHLAYPTMLGTAAGLRSVPPVSDEPLTARNVARFETR